MMDEATSTNDKVIFAVTFLAVLVTLSNYKDYLTKIDISIISHSFSVYDLLIYVSMTLFCSVYFSAIDKLRYNNLRLFSFKFLGITNFFAEFFYVVSILLLPGIFFALFFCSCIYSYEIYPLLTALDLEMFYHLNASDFMTGISLIFPILALIYIIITLWQTRKIENINSIKEAYDNVSTLIMNANEAYKGGNYESLLIIINSIIENKLFTRLAEKQNLKRNLLSQNSILEIAINNKILNNEQIELIKKIRSLRNKVAHGMLETPLDKDFAKELLDKTKKLVSEL